MLSQDNGRRLMVATERTKQLQSMRTAALDSTIVLGLFAFLAFMLLTGRPGQLGELMQGEMRRTIGFFVSAQFLLAVPVIFLLEQVMPARPEQRGFSASILFDALYMLIHMPVIIAFMVFISGPIDSFLDEHLSFLVLDATRSWPLWLIAIVGLLITDFFNWFVHLVKHKVSWFWRFHMIHHSQKRMNLFTSNRTHPVDALIDHFVLLLPFFFIFPSFTEEATAVFLLSVFNTWATRFTHANIGTNLGPLRYVLVTPQSHRVHHSTEPEHWNSNYANLFAWDRLFGTQHPDVTSYPPTGINDQFFPEPEKVGVREFASSFVGQMLFPLDKEAVRRASTGSPYDNSETPAY